MVLSNPSVFILGATGYLGGEFLILLARSFPGLNLHALVRNPTQERVSQLQSIYPGISIVEGTLEDDIIIQENVQEVGVVINVASSDHWSSVKYDARGEPVDHVQEYSDIGLVLKKCPPTNTHLDSDIPVRTFKYDYDTFLPFFSHAPYDRGVGSYMLDDCQIVEAGTRRDNAIRTIIIFPAQIYGVGSGVQKTTLWLRFFTNFAKQLGYAGTWGRGYNSMNNIHVKDCASAVLAVFRAALEGKAEEGAEGLYFAGSTAPKISYREWTKVMGDHLHSRGLLQHPGTRPMPEEIVNTMGHYGWFLLGGNQYAKHERLAKLGWEPSETFKRPFLDELPAAIDVAWGSI